MALISYRRWMASVLLLVVSALLVSCHSDYLTLNYKAHHGAIWNEDSTQVVFAASTSAYRSAIGISRFPDGGTPKYLIRKMGLYIFNLRSGELIQIASFDDLVEWQGNTPSIWKTQISISDTAVCFHIEPITEWQWFAEHANKDTLQMKQLKGKYADSFSYSLENGITIEINTVDYADQKKIGLTELNKILKKIPLANWGLEVKKIYPKPDIEYIEETIYLDNESSTTRRAVVEQIITSKELSEIKHILQRMKDYENSLDGLEREEYELYSKETYDQIEALLSSPGT